MTWVMCHDAGSEDATLAFLAVEGAKYNLQLKEGGGEFANISDKLERCIVRKKNLKPGTSYTARVRNRPLDESSEWSEWSQETLFSTLPAAMRRMECPKLLTHDRESVTICWYIPRLAHFLLGTKPTTRRPSVLSLNAECHRSVSYQESDSAWTDVNATLTGLAMRKKNLAADKSYFFRVRPVLAGVSAPEYAYSPPSAGLAVAPPVSRYIRDIVGGESASLETASGELRPAASLGGKIVALYASASWCGPCKQFTPRLAKFYAEMKAAGKPFEVSCPSPGGNKGPRKRKVSGLLGVRSEQVVFISCDRDARSFKGYLSHMPWPAIPFEHDARELALASMQVQGIPRLQVVGQNGKVLVDNAVSTPLSAQTFDYWFAGGSV